MRESDETGLEESRVENVSCLLFPNRSVGEKLKLMLGNHLNAKDWTYVNYSFMVVLELLIPLGYPPSILVVFFRHTCAGYVGQFH